MNVFGSVLLGLVRGMALSGDTLWGELLLGLAHHRAGAGGRAERHFVAGMAALSADERRQWLDPEWLLDPPERRAVRSLDTQARADYERRFWLLNDPFWITPENERWNEHVARHIETSLLEAKDLCRFNQDVLSMPVARIFFDRKRSCFYYDKDYSEQIKKDMLTSYQDEHPCGRSGQTIK